MVRRVWYPHTTACCLTCLPQPRQCSSESAEMQRCVLSKCGSNGRCGGNDENCSSPFHILVVSGASPWKIHRGNTLPFVKLLTQIFIEIHHRGREALVLIAVCEQPQESSHRLEDHAVPICIDKRGRMKPASEVLADRRTATLWVSADVYLHEVAFNILAPTSMCKLSVYY
jgi:hypothetical protein